MSPESNTSRSLSPTMLMMAWNSSLAAMPCWMLLISVSSPVRWASSAVRSASRAGSAWSPAAGGCAGAGPSRSHRKR